MAMSLGVERQLGCGSQPWGTLYVARGVRASLLSSSWSYCSLSGSLCPSCVEVTFLGLPRYFPSWTSLSLLCALWRKSILGGGRGRRQKRLAPLIVSNHSQGFTQSFFILPNHCHLQASSGPSSWSWGSTQSLEMAFLLAVSPLPAGGAALTVPIPGQ